MVFPRCAYKPLKVGDVHHLGLPYLPMDTHNSLAPDNLGFYNETPGTILKKTEQGRKKRNTPCVHCKHKHVGVSIAIFRLLIELIYCMLSVLEKGQVHVWHVKKRNAYAR